MAVAFLIDKFFFSLETCATGACRAEKEARTGKTEKRASQKWAKIYVENLITRSGDSPARGEGARLLFLAVSTFLCSTKKALFSFVTVGRLEAARNRGHYNEPGGEKRTRKKNEQRARVIHIQMGCRSWSS